MAHPFLHPAFVVDAPPALPDATGDHRITGRTANGDELFSSTSPCRRSPTATEAPPSPSFSRRSPGGPETWPASHFPARAGSATLDSDTDLSTTILLDPSTGEVRAILRDLPEADAAALAPQAGPDSLDVLFSRGIPDAAAWSR